MIKALAIKELRESVGVVCLAALGMAWLVGRLMGFNPLQSLLATFHTEHLAFLGDGFYMWSIHCVGALAILLGLKQTAWEVHHHTFYFLMHRPVSRRMVLASKLVVGCFAVFGVLAIAILVYGAWAATPGHLSAPFEWSMTADTWKLAAMLPLVYLGAFLTGIRPGRWFGTRLVPLVAACLLVTLCIVGVFWWLQWPVLLVSYAIFLMAIDYYTQTRDF